MNNTVRWIVVGLVVIVFIFLAGGFLVLMEDTLVDRRLFLGIILAITLVSAVVGARYWTPVTKTHNYAINFIVHTVVVAIVLGSVIVMVNYFTADFENAEPEKVLVERKFQKTRYHSRRSGRRSYERGEPYQVYYLRLDLPKVGSRELQVSKKTYNQVRSGEEVSVLITKGGLGLPVVSPASVKSVSSPKRKRHTSLRRKS